VTFEPRFADQRRPDLKLHWAPGDTMIDVSIAHPLAAANRAAALQSSPGGTLVAMGAALLREREKTA